jgi:hypothetical protein
MAKGDVVVFQEAMYDLLKGVHGDLSSATLKCGIVDNTKTPVANEATPRWADFSTNEVSTAGNYTSGGETLTTVVIAMVAGIATITADDVVISESVSGFTDGYWAIIYNSSATNDEALLAIDLGGPESEQAGDVSIEFSSGIVFQLPANALTWATPVT